MIPKLGAAVSGIGVLPLRDPFHAWTYERTHPRVRFLLGSGIIGKRSAAPNQHTERRSVYQAGRGRRRVCVPDVHGPAGSADAAPAPSGRRADARPTPSGRRADARRNEQTLLEAAAAVFVESGVDAPVREIVARAGVGMGTIYRHFPTRADLIVAVYRHQVEGCASAGPTLLASRASPHAALAEWIDLFVDFLVTKHGLAAALQSDDASFEALHAYFLDRLVPVCTRLLDAAVAAGEIQPDVRAYELMRAVGNLCAGVGSGSRYDAHRMVQLLITGLGRPSAIPQTEAGQDNSPPMAP
jgi:AcrR family transcriptional regulator